MVEEWKLAFAKWWEYYTADIKSDIPTDPGMVNESAFKAAWSIQQSKIDILTEQVDGMWNKLERLELERNEFTYEADEKLAIAIKALEYYASVQNAVFDPFTREWVDLDRGANAHQTLRMIKKAKI
jgi:5'-deoxynucleotidase YfbR-like HD superfamily hydrolase